MFIYIYLLLVMFVNNEWDLEYRDFFAYETLCWNAITTFSLWITKSWRVLSHFQNFIYLFIFAGKPLIWVLAQHSRCNWIPGWMANALSARNYCLSKLLSHALSYCRWYLWKMQFNTRVASELELSESDLCSTQITVFKRWSSNMQHE